MPTHTEKLRNLWATESEVIKNAQEKRQLVRHVTDEVVKTVRERISTIKEGYSPRKGIDYSDGKTPTDKELLSLIRPLIPKVKNGITPSDTHLLSLIQPLIPKVKDGEPGKSWTKDEIIDLFKPTIEAMAVSQQTTLQEKEEEGKKSKDELEGIIKNEVAKKISEVKRFGGGGSGDRVAAGSGVTITENVIGEKIIAVTGGGASNILTETVTAAQNGADVDIDLTQLANTYTGILLVVYNGQVLNQLRWSILSDIMTVTSTLASRDFQIQYAF